MPKCEVWISRYLLRNTSDLQTPGEQEEEGNILGDVWRHMSTFGGEKDICFPKTFFSLKDEFKIKKKTPLPFFFVSFLKATWTRWSLRSLSPSLQSM